MKKIQSMKIILPFLLVLFALSLTACSLWSRLSVIPLNFLSEFFSKKEPREWMLSTEYYKMSSPQWIGETGLYACYDWEQKCICIFNAKGEEQQKVPLSPPSDPESSVVYKISPDMKYMATDKGFFDLKGNPVGTQFPFGDKVEQKPFASVAPDMMKWIDSDHLAIFVREGLYFYTVSEDKLKQITSDFTELFEKQAAAEEHKNSIADPSENYAYGRNSLEISLKPFTLGQNAKDGMPPVIYDGSIYYTGQREIVEKEIITGLYAANINGEQKIYGQPKRNNQNIRSVLGINGNSMIWFTDYMLTFGADGREINYFSYPDRKYLKTTTTYGLGLIAPVIPLGIYTKDAENFWLTYHSIHSDQTDFTIEKIPLNGDLPIRKSFLLPNRIANTLPYHTVEDGKIGMKVIGKKDDQNVYVLITLQGVNHPEEQWIYVVRVTVNQSRPETTIVWNFVYETSKKLIVEVSPDQKTLLVGIDQQPGSSYSMGRVEMKDMHE